MQEVKTYPDKEQLAQAMAERFTALAQEAIETRERFTVALSGGSTPKALFELLATEAFAGQIDWEKVHVFWGDERCVPPDHKDSNYRMAHDALLGHVPIPEDNIHRIQGELPPQKAATAYANTLRNLFEANPPPLDLILLGMGDDGHTASLFPGLPAIYEHNRLVVAHYVSQLKVWRVTLTPVVINAARHVVFLVTGENKAARLRQVLRGVYQPHLMPAQIVRPRKGTLTWMVDADAAALLKSL
jgi:6-phosphogluconolactonase